MRRTAIALAACCLSLLAGCGSSPQFVTRRGSDLELNGQRWRFLGFNDYELTSVPGATNCGRYVDDRTLNGIMADARASGASVIRTWFFQSYYDMSNATGAWRRVTPSWRAFDRVLAAAASHHLRVIPVLVNEFRDCEATTFNKNLYFFQAGYSHVGYGYPLTFRQYAVAVARHYANNGTIAFWQLGNELQSDPSPRCAERAGARALRGFADDMTAALGAVDRHHLVSLGTVGADDCGLRGPDYQYVHAGRIDLCEYHDYGLPIRPLPSGPARLQRRIGQCAALNKPLFIGESGIPADVGDNGASSGRITSTSLRLRAGFFDAKITAAFNAGLAGYLIWDKRQDASNSRLNYGFGRYIVGPDNLFFDPTNSATALLARTFGQTPGSVRFGFEDGRIDGWHGSAGVLLRNTQSLAWQGTHSLAIVILHGARTVSTTGPAAPGVRPGITVTYHVYVPSYASPGLRALPFAAVPGGGRVLASARSELTAGWNVITWKIPRASSASLSAIGLEVGNPLGWSGPLLLDSVSW